MSSDSNQEQQGQEIPSKTDRFYAMIEGFIQARESQLPTASKEDAALTHLMRRMLSIIKTMNATLSSAEYKQKYPLNEDTARKYGVGICKIQEVFKNDLDLSELIPDEFFFAFFDFANEGEPNNIPYGTWFREGWDLHKQSLSS
jgi:hypothetical protein